MPPRRVQGRQVLGSMLVLLAQGALAQRPDCPVRSAPMPMSPPGPPPSFVPVPVFPERFGDEVKLPPPAVLPPAVDLVLAEEGHLTAFVARAEGARGQPPPPEVLRSMVDPARTELAQWRFLGYVPEGPRHKVTRAFSRDGSVLVFEQWNMAADGASIAGKPRQDVEIGHFRGHWGGLRTPSGCVSTTLAWDADGISYAVSIAGTLARDAQRLVLLRVARSIASTLPPPQARAGRSGQM